MSVNTFTNVQVRKPTRSKFSLTHDVKSTCNMGQLVPVLTLECLPGDVFDLSAESLVRLQPLVSPMMHRLDARVEYFFVPNRILWDNWEEFISDGNGKGDGTGPTPALPYLQIEKAGPPEHTWGKLDDYFGIPSPVQAGNSSSPEKVSALPYAAYQLIYDQYYRDQNLQTSTFTKLSNGDNSLLPDIKTFRNRAWQQDLFTSGLPSPQKGPEVLIPITGDVDIANEYPAPFYPKWRDADTGFDAGDPTNNRYAGVEIQNGLVNNPSGVVMFDGSGVPVKNMLYDPQGTLKLYSSDTNINDLRRSQALQRVYEKFARTGSRYAEFLKNFFGVKAQDSRLDRPEFITSVKTPVMVSEVLQTGETATTPQGNMAGHGVAIVNGRGSKYFCAEHGYIIGIFNIQPVTAYQQGIARHFLKFDPLDYALPEFAHIGEQAVYNRELYAFQGATGSDTFAYMPRFYEYRHINSLVTGQMRDTLDFWHLGRIFGSAPQLNEAFIKCIPDDRVFAVNDPTQDLIIFNVLHHIGASRCLPYYGTPI